MNVSKTSKRSSKRSTNLADLWDINQTNPLEMKPDELRDRLRIALSALTFERYAAVRRTIVEGLRRGRINVAAVLLMNGSMVSTVDEVLPSDLAHLLRYVRINQPQALEAVEETLSGVLNESARTTPTRLVA